MSRTVVLAAAISLALAACSGKESTPVSDAQKTPAQQPAEASTNPLLSASTLPFQAPPFDKIKDSDFAPACWALVLAAGVAAPAEKAGRARPRDMATARASLI